MSNDVRRPKQYEDMLSDLCQSDKKIFLSYKDALVFAACLGYVKNIKKSFDKSSEPVGMHIFKGEFDESVFQCIGLKRKIQQLCQMKNMDKRIKLFEEYAAGGLELLKARVYEGPEDWDSALVGLIVEYEAEEKNILDDITNIAG